MWQNNVCYAKLTGVSNEETRMTEPNHGVDPTIVSNNMPVQHEDVERIGAVRDKVTRLDAVLERTQLVNALSSFEQVASGMRPAIEEDGKWVINKQASRFVEQSVDAATAGYLELLAACSSKRGCRQRCRSDTRSYRVCRLR